MGWSIIGIVLTSGLLPAGCQGKQRTPGSPMLGGGVAHAPQVVRPDVEPLLPSGLDLAKGTSPKGQDIKQAGMQVSESPLTPPPTTTSTPSPMAPGLNSIVQQELDQPVNLAPLSRTEANPSLRKVQEIYTRAREQKDGIRNYIVRLKRREVIDGKALPEDLLLCQYRDQPFSVYMKSLEGSPTAGREVVFVKGKFNNMMQIRTGRGDVMPGIRLELSPQSPRATLNARRTIDESGFSNIIKRFEVALQRDLQSSTEADAVIYVGQLERPESSYPYDVVLQHIPPGQEKHLPNGGQRFWYFCADPKAAEYGLPTLITTFDEKKREVEYYFHDRLVVNVDLDERDFDPDRLWASR